MSQFLEALRGEITGKEKALLQPLSVSVRRTPEHALDIRTIQEYVVTAQWQVRGFCARKDQENFLKNVYRELQEAMYGHFRGRLLLMERCIYEEDREKLLMHMRDLFREIEG